MGVFVDRNCTKETCQNGSCLFLIFISDYTRPTGTKLTWNVHWIILYKIYLFFVNWNCTKETNCFLVFCIIKMHKILKFCIFGSISLKPLELEEIHQLNTTRSSRHNQNKEKMLQNWMKNKNSIYLLNMWNLLILCPFSNSKICCGPQKPIMMIILQKTALKWMKNKVKILIFSPFMSKTVS